MSENNEEINYTIKRIGKDAETLYGNTKVLEAFAIADENGFAGLETVEGKWFIVCKHDNFKEMLDIVAKQNKTIIEYVESEGINLQVGSEDATVQGE